MQRSRGLSLIEVLIVMGIIALLTSILVPAVKGVRQRGRVASDQSNLRQLSLAHQAYANANRGFIVDVGLAHGGFGQEEKAWINTLESYYDNELIVRSPLDNSPHWTADAGGEGVPLAAGNFRRTSYGCNNFLTSFNPTFSITGDPSDLYDRLHKIRQPAGTVHFLHMAQTGAYAGADHVHVENWSQPFGGVPLAEAPLRAFEESEINAVSGREISREDVISGAISSNAASPLWEGVSNYAFVDGSIKALGFSDVFTDFERNRFDPSRSGRFHELVDAE